MDDDIASNLGTMEEHNVFVLAQALLNSSVSGKSFLSLPILVYNPVHSYEYTFHTFAKHIPPRIPGLQPQIPNLRSSCKHSRSH
jgi:hypothetical protein